MQITMLIVITTLENHEDAERLAQLLVEQQLAACVQIIPKITSIYRWQGKIEKSDEVLLLIKSNSEKYSELEKAIKDNHPYEVPEIVTIPVEKASQDYLNWLTNMLE